MILSTERMAARGDDEATSGDIQYIGRLKTIYR